jgi:hypothetical protein
MKDPKENKTSDFNGELDPKDIFKAALDTRNLEINLFWQRSNYFLVLNTALAVGFFNAKAKPDACILAAIGFLVALLWYRVNLGSKYWYSRWEHRLKLVEKAYAPGLNLFSADWPVIQDDVRKSLNIDEHHGFRRMLDKQVLRKPSVSVAMIILSLLFVIGWIALFVFKVLAKPISVAPTCMR